MFVSLAFKVYSYWQNLNTVKKFCKRGQSGMNDTFTYLHKSSTKNEYLPYLEYCIGFAFTPKYDSMLSFVIKKSMRYN